MEPSFPSSSSSSGVSPQPFVSWESSPSTFSSSSTASSLSSAPSAGTSSSPSTSTTVKSRMAFFEGFLKSSPSSPSHAPKQTSAAAAWPLPPRSPESPAHTDKENSTKHVDLLEGLVASLRIRNEALQAELSTHKQDLQTAISEKVRQAHVIATLQAENYDWEGEMERLKIAQANTPHSRTVHRSGEEERDGGETATTEKDKTLLTETIGNLEGDLAETNEQRRRLLELFKTGEETQQRLRRDHEELTKEHKDKVRKLAECQSREMRQSAELSALQEKERHLLKCLKDSRGEQQMLEDLLETAEAKHKTLIREYEDKHHVTQKEMQVLQSDQQEQLSQSLAQMDSLKDQLTEATAELDDVQQQLAKQRHEELRMQQQLAAHEHEQERLKTRMEESETQRKELHELLQTAESEQKTMRSQLSEKCQILEGEIQQLNSTARDRQEETDNISLQVESLEQDLLEANSEKNRLKSTISTTDGAREELEVKYKQATAELDDCQQKMADQRDKEQSLRQELAAHQQEQGRLATRMEESETQRKELHELLQTAESEQKTMRSQLSEKCQILEGEIQQLNSTARDRQEETDNISLQVESLEQDLLEANSEKNRLKSTISTTDGAREELEVKYKKATAELDDVQQQLAKQRHEELRMQQQLAAHEHEQERLKTRMEESETQRKELHELLQTAESEQKTMRSQLSEAYQSLAAQREVSAAADIARRSRYAGYDVTPGCAKESTSSSASRPVGSTPPSLLPVTPADALSVCVPLQNTDLSRVVVVRTQEAEEGKVNLDCWKTCNCSREKIQEQLPPAKAKSPNKQQHFPMQPSRLAGGASRSRHPPPVISDVVDAAVRSLRIG
eukprot:GHVS01050839.1.p1 GENE.GHVS01050839.1~~GHVS01050839.1.p1  ORF type:complete len:852 (+),score=210.06 GHVS01050839.1:60-2615(+)